MSLILPDKLLADVAWCVGTIRLTEYICHTFVSGLIWPDITVELSCWCFCECFMTCVDTDQFKELYKICLHFIFL